jgi:hypothetical protein
MEPNALPFAILSVTMQKNVMRKATTFSLLVTTAILLISCTNFGDKVVKDYVEVYYKDNITKEQAQQTLDILHPSWNEPGNKKSVQLTKAGDTVNFRMVINEEKAKDVKDEAYILLASEISTAVFNGSPVNVDLTDDGFKTIRTVHYKKLEAENYGQKTTEGNIEIYAKEGINEDEVKKLAAFLDQLDGTGGNTKSFQASKDNTGLYVISMVANREQSEALGDQAFNELAGVISDSVFNASPVVLQLTDYTFKPFRSFKHE